MSRFTFALIPIGCLLVAGTPAISVGQVSADRKGHEKRLTQQLERLLARLRAATTTEEKNRLERAIVELVRGELRGTWLEGTFTLLNVDAKKHGLRVALAGTALTVEGIHLAKDARVWLDDQPGGLADLSAGMAVALQVAADGEQWRIVGVRASKGNAAATADIDRLIRQLGSDRFSEREAASKALAALGTAARPALTRAAKVRDAEVRARARRLLAALQNKADTWYLSANHAAPPDRTKRCSIVQADDGKTYCVNERGERSQVTVAIHCNHLEVNALGWGLKGRIERDREGTRIKWANGSKWTQRRR
jgi:hypothetical protein